MLREKETRRALGQFEVMRRECMAGRKCIAAMAKKKEEMDAELATLRDIVSSLSEKMDTWRLRHEILASQRDRSEATMQVCWVLAC